MDVRRGGYLIFKIRLLNGRLFNRLLAQDGRALYNAEQGKILSTLWDKHPQSATDIAKETGLANSTLSLMLKRLEEQELIVSTLSKEDKRRKVFDLTPLSLQQEEVGKVLSQQLGEVFYKNFTPTEIKQLHHYLERIVENLESELK